MLCAWSEETDHERSKLKLKFTIAITMIIMMILV